MYDTKCYWVYFVVQKTKEWILKKINSMKGLMSVLHKTLLCREEKEKSLIFTWKIRGWMIKNCFKASKMFSQRITILLRPSL